MEMKSVENKRDDGFEDIIEFAKKYDHYTEDGKSHEVWYADAVTLNYWKQVVKGQGYERIAIWRMNGNDLSTLQKVIKDGVIYEKEE